MPSTRKKKLGRGLDALLGGSGVTMDEAMSAAAVEPQKLPDGSQLMLLDPRALRPNPKQPRRVFNDELLEELSASIKRDGVQEPVLVREIDGVHEIVSGERRVRAAVLADLEEIPAICRDVSDSDMLRLGLIENIQREDLNAIELAEAYHNLIEEFAWTQEELSAQVGKKRATVTNTLRLLHLPELVQEMVADGSLTMGHARALLAIEDPARQAAGARAVIRDGLSVRQTEKLATASKPKAKGKRKKSAQKDPHFGQIEDDLRRSLGTKVRLNAGNGGRGRIEIEYFNAEELERLLDLLCGRR